MILRTLLLLHTPLLRRRVKRLLEGPEFDLTLPHRASRPWKELNRGDFDLVVAERPVLADSPTDFVDALRQLPEHPDVIVLADREDAGERARLLASGCLAVLNTGLPDEILRDAFRALLLRKRDETASRLRRDREEARPGLSEFAARSPAMRSFLELPRRVAASDTSILVLGETGVGKERLARAIHQESPRSSGPFLAINCGALPESLLESELFGHEEGAFTGATRSRRGFFELAHRGTLFLDEIGDMPLHLQSRLLRVIEDKSLRRVGGERMLPVDVRIMAATHRNPDTEIQAGRFREDLYYRLAVVTLHVPPLRERAEDIPALVTEFLARFRPHTDRRIETVEEDALQALLAYPWPGNIRELRNVIEQACLLGSGPVLRREDLPGRIRTRNPSSAGTPLPPAPAELYGRPLPEARREVLDAFDRTYLERLLRETRGRVGEAARRAGVSERHLFELMRRHGVRKESFRR